MTSIWAESVAPALDDALITLALAVGVCEGDIWETRGTRSKVLDYYLTGDLSPWAGPPAPFTDHAHWRDFTSLPGPWQQSEILGYIEHCRQRVRDTFDGLTDERAATPTPPTHQGKPYAKVFTGLVAHTTEHAAQILQHVNAVARRL